MSVLVQALQASIVLLSSIIIHELGHFAVANGSRLRPRIVFTKMNGRYTLFTEFSSKIDRKTVIYSGIISGLLYVLVVSVLLGFSVSFMLITTAVYLYGCRRDFEALK